jgi:anthranilate synthase component 2
MKVLIIDNYDSFTYNLVQAFGALGARVSVIRNDQESLDEIESRKPARIVLSPGPGGPSDAGICVDAVRRFAGRIDILGVCLGHQCIGAAFGARIVHAARLMHGKTSAVFHEGESVLRGLPNPFTAARYHSLAVSRRGFPAALRIIAAAEDGTIMGLRSRTQRVTGIQFHPESFMTKGGLAILRTFLEGRG